MYVLRPHERPAREVKRDTTERASRGDGLMAQCNSKPRQRDYGHHKPPSFKISAAGTGAES
jgi:hypothetical protein